MQNFKSYLKENSENYFVVSIEHRTIENNYEEFVKNIQEFIKQKGYILDNIYGSKSGSDTFFVYNLCVNDKYPNMNLLFDFKNKFDKDIEDKYEYFLHQSEIISLQIINELPEGIYLDFPQEDIDVIPKKPITLHNIHKKINCRKLQFYNFRIKNIIKGNVLGILKIKSLQFITLLNSNSDNPKWYDIVRKHFYADREVVTCAEELIENGLKEYAKL